MTTKKNIENIANEIVDDVIVRNYASFAENIRNTGYFKPEKSPLKIINEIGMVILPFERQFMIDDALTLLSEIINLNVLCKVRSKDGRTSHVTAFSMPYQDEMFILSMHSEQHGIVNEIGVTFYHSMEQMFSILQETLQTIDNKNWIMEEQKEMAELYRIFM